MDQQQPNTDPAQHAAAEIMRRLRAKERELRETQATLEREREAHGRSASAVAHHREASVVKLSIGGTRFTTSRSTLVPASGFFSAYLSGRIPPTLDDAGAIFVDRDAQHFPQVLAFLRDGAMPRWGSDEEREALEREADFYQIEALMRESPKTLTIIDHWGFPVQPATGEGAAGGCADDGASLGTLLRLGREYPQCHVKLSALFRVSLDAYPHASLDAMFASVVEAFGASKAENGEYLTADTMTKLMEAFCARRPCSRLSVKAPWLPTRSDPGEAVG